MSQKSSGYLKSVQHYKLMKSQIIDYKKTKLFHLYYMYYYIANFCTKKRKENILHKQSQSKYLFKETLMQI